MRRKILYLLLCAVMVMAAVSIEALASGLEMAAITAEREAGEAVSWSQAAGYELKVGGVQVTAANKDVITAAINEKWGPGSASGTITYTPSDRWDEPSRLTLNNACISRGIFSRDLMSMGTSCRFS